MGKLSVQENTILQARVGQLTNENNHLDKEKNEINEILTKLKGYEAKRAQIKDPKQRKLNETRIVELQAKLAQASTLIAEEFSEKGYEAENIGLLLKGTGPGDFDAKKAKALIAKKGLRVQVVDIFSSNLPEGREGCTSCNTQCHTMCNTCVCCNSGVVNEVLMW